jgi:hypothetical protein
METTWRVVKVTATEGRTLAELVRVEWFKKGADFIEAEGTLTLDISGDDDPEMWPGADVFLHVSVVDPVDA